MAVSVTKDGRYFVYYRVPKNDGGSRIKKEYFGRGLDSEAAAGKRDDELDLKKRRPKKITVGAAFSELAKSYFDKKDFNENSRKHLKIRLEATLLPFFGAKSAIQLKDKDLDDYVARRRKTVKNSTIARELTDVLAILNWSTGRRPPLIPFNPVKDYKKPKSDDAIILPPTPEETELIMAHAAPHLRRAITLSYYLGLRPGAVELLGLTWIDVNFTTQTILVQSAHKGGPDRRYVPIHENLSDPLIAWWAEDGASGPIIHYHGKPIKKIQTAWRIAMEKSGITRRIRPYDMRHNFVTQALENGADIKALADIVGSKPETLMRHYQHVSRRLHRETVAKIPPLGIQNIPKKKGLDRNVIRLNP